VSARILFLDVDGVLSPFDPVPGGESTRWGPIAMPYRRAVTEWIHRLVAGGVEVMWLTTWSKETVLQLAEDLGLPVLEVPDEVPGTDDRPTRLRGWKTTTALSVVAARQPARWAWADDRLRGPAMRRIRMAHPEALLISPNGTIGLTDDHLHRIEAWLMAEPIAEVARQLNAALGTTLVAALSGATVSTVPDRWVQPGGPVPSPQEEERLRAAHRIWTQLAGTEGPDVARAWFIGANPVLEEQAPYLALRTGAIEETIAAAAAFTTGTWAE